MKLSLFCTECNAYAHCTITANNNNDTAENNAVHDLLKLMMLN